MAADPAAALALMRTRFIANALQQARALQALLGEDGQAPSGDARVEAHRIAHKLAGSAGTFGFAEAGRKAAALEALLEDPAGDAPRAAAELAKLMALLTEAARPPPAG